MRKISSESESTTHATNIFYSQIIWKWNMKINNWLKRITKLNQNNSQPKILIFCFGVGCVLLYQLSITILNLGWNTYKVKATSLWFIKSIWLESLLLSKPHVLYRLWAACRQKADSSAWTAPLIIAALTFFWRPRTFYGVKLQSGTHILLWQTFS